MGAVLGAVLVAVQGVLWAQFWVLGGVLGATVDIVCARTIGVNLPLLFWSAADVS